VDLGLAAAIATAATLVWIQRRRRYVPRPPSAELRLDDPDLAPLPPVVRQVRRGLRDATCGRSGDAGTGLVVDADLPDTEARIEERDQDVDTCDGDPNRDDDVVAGGVGLDDARAGDTDPVGRVPLPGPGLVPVAPALGHPLLRAWPPAGLGLTGPGGHAVARGLLVAALTTGGVDEFPAGGRVVIPAGTLATLLGPQAPPIPVPSG
jgi:hypothetical protein